MSFAFYPFYPGDYARDTGHLSLMQHGAYRLLIDLYMVNGPITNDMDRLCRTLRAMSVEERAAIEFVLVEFFRLDGNRWTHARCEVERSQQAHRSEAASASARARWQRRNPAPTVAREAEQVDANAYANAYANALPTQCDRYANHNHNHNHSSSSLRSEEQAPQAESANAEKPESAPHVAACSGVKARLHPSSSGQAAVKQPRGTRLPAEWTLDSMPNEWRSFCRTTRPDLDPDVTADRFADYWRAQPGQKGVKVDWLATWRNWVRNESAPRVTSQHGYESPRERERRERMTGWVSPELLRKAPDAAPPVARVVTPLFPDHEITEVVDATPRRLG